MNTKVRLEALLYFIAISITIVGGIFFLANYYSSDVVPGEEQEWKLLQLQPDIEIPGDKERERIQEEYERILKQIEEFKMPEEIYAIYNNVMASKVSSIANKNFNRIKEIFNDYSEKITEVKSTISNYDELYEKYAGLEDEIPWFWFNAKQEYADFMTSIEEINKHLQEEVQELSNIESQLENYYSTSKQRADELFNRDYYDLTIICFYEDGDGSALGIACVANVIENRINSPQYWYAHNAHDVIWAENQYEPTWTTPMNKTTPRVQKIVEDFLRGRIETGMPSNVLYQASFKQGETWDIIDNQYFCYG